MSLPIDNKFVNLMSARLRNFKQKNTNLYNFSCPICGDSQKNKTKARGYVYAKGNSLFYRCHNCNASTNLANLIRHIDASLHKEYVLEKYKTGELNHSNTRTIVFDIQAPKFDVVEKQKSFEYAEYCDTLPETHFCVKYLNLRRIPKEHLNKFLFTANYEKFVKNLFPNVDKEISADARLVIPYYDEYNDIIAVTGRALQKTEEKLRYVTVRSDEHATGKLIYGTERINKNKKVFIVEGPIDSLFVSNCVASGDSALLQTASQLKVDDCVLVWDNEPRNKQIANLMKMAIAKGMRVVIWPDNIKGKDINEMIINGTDNIDSIISNNTFSGIEAIMKFNYWKKV
jgi:transcription elongation factor Elf1